MILSVCRASAGSPITSTMPQARVSCILPTIFRWSVIGKESLLVRPYSLADPSTIELLKSLLRVNVGTTKKGLVYAYAFDDEISLGSFNNPAEVDIHPLSLGWYRRWLRDRYGRIQNLNKAWDTSYASVDEVEPVGFDEVRKSKADFSLQ